MILMIGGRTNNIGTGNNINVDEGRGGADWKIAYHNVNTGYRYKDFIITKQKYDEIKYMRGYALELWDDSFVSKGYNICNRNCSTYSVNLIFKYTGKFYNPIWNGTCNAPGAIYNQI